mmetsp:Transcript_3084/g.4803  ORF Transcript_3084/g.4803 Transcript_3084/m.4803 type:complete len:560 (-) Transcript_3084:129-1808(-)
MEEYIEELARENPTMDAATRSRIRNVDELIDNNEQKLNDIHCDKFDIVMSQIKMAGQSASRPRELQMQCGIQNRIVGHVKNQAFALGDVSNNFQWSALSTRLGELYRRGDGGLDWTRLGQEARMVFTCVPSFNVILGPIYQDEKIRRTAQRRKREDLSGVEEQRGKVVTNNGEDDDEEAKDEATNNRIDRMTEYFESLPKYVDSLGRAQGFDLLRVLVDPTNPVQTVENFFDYSHLHLRKRVAHIVDDSTGSIICKYFQTESALEGREKRQMVVSLKMKDLRDCAKLLFGGETSCDQDRGGSSTSSSSSNNRNRNSSGHNHHSNITTSQFVAPLHREDPIYRMSTAKEQIDYLTQQDSGLRSSPPTDFPPDKTTAIIVAATACSTSTSKGTAKDKRNRSSSISMHGTNRSSSNNNNKAPSSSSNGCNYMKISTNNGASSSSSSSFSNENGFNDDNATSSSSSSYTKGSVRQQQRLKGSILTLAAPAAAIPEKQERKRHFTPIVDVEELDLYPKRQRNSKMKKISVTSDTCSALINLVDDNMSAPPSEVVDLVSDDDSYS